MTEAMVHVNGVDLCVETFGDPAMPAVLLISGAAASMDWWDAGFCERLAGGGRFVVRYDHRDTGRSVAYPPGVPGYTGPDLARDAAGLIEALAAGRRAHVVGISMGGGIGQYLAILHPDRVATLTLMSTSPGPADDLPPMADGLRAVLAGPPPEPDWTDRDAVVEYLVEEQRPFAGPGFFDEARVRAVVRRVVGRTADLKSANNHWILEGDEDLRPRLGEVTAPVLVIHGTEDGLFPPGHGAALAREIPGAELLLLEGVGHQVPPPSTWDIVVPAILRHTAPG